MVHRIRCGNGNCYLISNGTDAVLVDTGREKYWQKVLNACRLYNVRLLVLTHGHVDHVQNALFLSNALECPTAMHEADVPLLADNMRQPLSAHSPLGKLVLSESVKSFQRDRIPAFTPDFFLEDGCSLEKYKVPANIIGLPGHTRGSIGIDIMEKDLIVGDALMNLFYPAASMLYNDREAMLQSADRISRLGKRRIFFGHGGPGKNRDRWR